MRKILHKKVLTVLLSFAMLVSGSNISSLANGTNVSAASDHAELSDRDGISIPDYLDSKLWGTPGLHAYLSYQTTTWDFRNEYESLQDRKEEDCSWEYIQAAGEEVTAEQTTVTDVRMTKDGEYMVAIEGIDLSAAKQFNMLSVSTDISTASYPDVTATDAVVKFDGKEVADAPLEFSRPGSDPYYNFMLINTWAPTPFDYSLGSANENEMLTMPSHSIEITFKISGIQQAWQDIKSGDYIDPETGKTIAELNANRSKIPDYIDETLWGTPGLHAYLAYQTTTWDYRNDYGTLKDGGLSWEYIQAAGEEVTAKQTIVTDVLLTEDGEYTVAIEGIDLSAAEQFNKLSVATDISSTLYPDIEAADAVVKFDGKEVADAPLEFAREWDDPYYNFRLINEWAPVPGNYALGSPHGKLTMPSHSIEITFKISGLQQALEDIESGTYIDQETGETINSSDRFGSSSSTEIPENPDGTETPDDTKNPDGTEPPDNPDGTKTPDDPSATDSPSTPTQTPEQGSGGGSSTTITPTPAPTNNAGASNGGDGYSDDDDDEKASGLPKGSTFNAGKFRYKVTRVATDEEDGAVMLIGMTAKGKTTRNLKMPTSVTSAEFDDYAVTSIGSKAFSGSKAVSITLNKRIKTIPDSAFANCKKLQTITFKAKLKKAAKNAFNGCKKKIKIIGTKKAANKKLLKKQTSYKKFK